MRQDNAPEERKKRTKPQSEWADPAIPEYESDVDSKADIRTNAVSIVAEVLAIDTSGSMTGMRVTLAKEVSRLAMRRLLPHDKVGIVEFYGTKQWAAPMQSAGGHLVRLS